MTGNDLFQCSICREPSGSICTYCTHDACGNHLCDRCGRCSDCCSCETHLNKAEDEFHGHGQIRLAVTSQEVHNGIAHGVPEVI
jgi:hypothetical protein